jgi:hypothetical protein
MNLFTLMFFFFNLHLIRFLLNHFYIINDGFNWIYFLCNMNLFYSNLNILSFSTCFLNNKIYFDWRRQTHRVIRVRIGVTKQWFLWLFLNDDNFLIRIRCSDYCRHSNDLSIWLCLFIIIRISEKLLFVNPFRHDLSRFIIFFINIVIEDTNFLNDIAHTFTWFLKFKLIWVK